MCGEARSTESVHEMRLLPLALCLTASAQNPDVRVTGGTGPG